MKTEQEQIKTMTKDEIKKAFAICCGVQDCTGCPILDMEKQNGLGCKFNLFTRVIDTVSEQEKEIKRLKEETSNIRKETAREILDMLYDMGIDKEILECCRIYDVDGVSLAKQICEKYSVEIEK